MNSGLPRPNPSFAKASGGSTRSPISRTRKRTPPDPSTASPSSRATMRSDPSASASGVERRGIVSSAEGVKRRTGPVAVPCASSATSLHPPEASLFARRFDHRAFVAAQRSDQACWRQPTRPRIHFRRDRPRRPSTSESGTKTTCGAGATTSPGVDFDRPHRTAPCSRGFVPQTTTAVALVDAMSNAASESSRC